MSTKLIATLACCAALALGACSGGGNRAATPTPDPTPGTPDPTPDPDPPEDRTEEEQEFDDELQKVETALTMAQEEIKAAVELRQAADTAEKRTAAQLQIEQAQRALAKVLTDALALSPPEEDTTGRDRRASLVAKATAAQTEHDAALRAIERGMGTSSVGWSGTTTTTVTRLTAVRASGRAPRKTVDDTNYNDDGDDLSTALKAADLPPVMYEDGKIVMRQGLDSSGDRLRMRGFPVRKNVSHTATVTADRGKLELPSGQQVDEADTNNDKFFAGLKITPTGLVMDLGQDSSAAGGGTDLRIDVAGSDSFLAANRNRYDLTLSFGTPSASHTGNIELYWTSTLMPTDAQANADASVLKASGRNLSIGTYYLRLSNHLGVDLGREDPNDPVASARDDANFYLSHAAYGLFDFIPRTGLGATQALGFSEDSRSFPFHAGYDAFKNAAGMKVTDVADADRITSGKFKGRTIAQELILEASGARRSFPPGASSPGNVAAMLRGDVELTATISSTAANNKLSGKIMNLEFWDVVRGYWQNYANVTRLTLAETSIGADGAFNGAITDPGANFSDGGYKGNFYGPLSGLEVAGAWFLNTDIAGSVDRAIVGSFGAAHVREDDTYGYVIRNDGN